MMSHPANISQEKKLIEALQSFMNNSVLPCFPDNHSSVSEWKFLSGILSGQPIDYNQIDFYLLMANKSGKGPAPGQRQTNQAPFISPRQYNPLAGVKPGSTRDIKVQSASSKRKQLAAKMASLHQTMVRNQQKLQSLATKNSDSSFQLNSSVRPSGAFAAGNRKFY